MKKPRVPSDGWNSHPPSATRATPWRHSSAVTHRLLTVHSRLMAINDNLLRAFHQPSQLENAASIEGHSIGAASDGSRAHDQCPFVRYSATRSITSAAPADGFVSVQNDPDAHTFRLFLLLHPPARSVKITRGLFDGWTARVGQSHLTVESCS